MVTDMWEIFQYGFMVRALTAGLIIALVAPVVGIFLVLRRYSLISDTLAHVSLSGTALGWMLGVNPMLSALAVSVGAGIFIEKLRQTKKAGGDTALSMFLTGSLAVAVILISISKGISMGLFNFLFGSIVTVTESDLITISIAAAVVVTVISGFFKELIFISFDEETARASGVKTTLVNQIFVILSAITITLCIPVVGALLISALVVVPVVTALQLKIGFVRTLVWSEVFSVTSVMAGIVIAFYANLPTGATIVMVLLTMFCIVAGLGRGKTIR